jgi:hypothetical protein
MKNNLTNMKNIVTKQSLSRTSNPLNKGRKERIWKRFGWLFVLILASSFAANAKSPVSFGLKMEVNVHEFWLYDLDNYASRLGIAPNLGCFLKTDLNDSYSIQSDLLLFSRNTRMKVYGRDDYFRQWGINLPVYLVKREYIDREIWYFGLGVYASAGLNAHMKNAGTDMYKRTEGKAFMNRWDYGISSMLGFEIHNGIQFNACLQLGLKDQLQAQKDDATAINKTITFGIGYRC